MQDQIDLQSVRDSVFAQQQSRQRTESTGSQDRSATLFHEVNPIADGGDDAASGAAAVEDLEVAEHLEAEATEITRRLRENAAYSVDTSTRTKRALAECYSPANPDARIDDQVHALTINLLEKSLEAPHAMVNGKTEW